MLPDQAISPGDPTNKLMLEIDRGYLVRYTSLSLERPSLHLIPA